MTKNDGNSDDRKFVDVPANNPWKADVWEVTRVPVKARYDPICVIEAVRNRWAEGWIEHEVRSIRTWSGQGLVNLLETRTSVDGERVIVITQVKNDEIWIEQELELENHELAPSRGSEGTFYHPHIGSGHPTRWLLRG
jgi:hypothetical protein